jgi:putative endonuclease
MSVISKKFGKEGEDIAVEMLIEKGYQIIERNYYYQTKGEIDIVAKDTETGFLVFVEVKSRKNLECGEPEYSITQSKISQIKRMAELYLYDKDIREIECRFDVITVLLLPQTSPVINHYINAFQ